TVTDGAGVEHVTGVHGNYVIFAKAGQANATLHVTDRHRGIYRAAVYQADTQFHAEFDPAQAGAAVPATHPLNWSAARLVLFVHDSRAVQAAPELTFGDGSKATLAPAADLSSAVQPYESAQRPSVSEGVQAFAAPMAFADTPRAFNVDAQLKVGGAERF